MTIGLHLYLATGIPAPADDQSDEERAWLAGQADRMAEEGGYIAIQGTRPQTLGFGLNDFPVGLLAWIVEKWRPGATATATSSRDSRRTSC